MTLDTPHGAITKFLKKCPNNAGKMRGKIIFSPLWCLIQKPDHNSPIRAFMQKIREKSLKTKSDIPLLKEIMPEVPNKNFDIFSSLTKFIKNEPMGTGWSTIMIMPESSEGGEICATARELLNSKTLTIFYGKNIKIFF